MKNLAQTETPRPPTLASSQPPAEPEPGAKEIDNARGLLREAHTYLLRTIAAHVRIDGMRLADEVIPGRDLLESFNIAASVALGAIEMAQSELDGGEAGHAWRACFPDGNSLDAAAEE